MHFHSSSSFFSSFSFILFLFVIFLPFVPFSSVFSLPLYRIKFLLSPINSLIPSLPLFSPFFSFAFFFHISPLLPLPFPSNSHTPSSSYFLSPFPSLFQLPFHSDLSYLPFIRHPFLILSSFSPAFSPLLSPPPCFCLLPPPSLSPSFPTPFFSPPPPSPSPSPLWFPFPFPP